MQHVRSLYGSRKLGNVGSLTPHRDAGVTANSGENAPVSGRAVTDLALQASSALEMSGRGGFGEAEKLPGLQAFHQSGRVSRNLRGRLASAGGAALLLICGAWLYCLVRGLLALLGVLS